MSTMAEPKSIIGATRDFMLDEGYGQDYHEAAPRTIKADDPTMEIVSALYRHLGEPVSLPEISEAARRAKNGGVAYLASVQNHMLDALIYELEIREKIAHGFKANKVVVVAMPKEEWGREL